MDISLDGGIVFTPTGAVFNAHPTLPQLEQALMTAAYFETRSPFWRGDVLLYLRDHYFSSYEQAIGITHDAIQTAYNLASVCRAFPMARRRIADGRTFSHYAAVKALPEYLQDELLNHSEQGGWTVAQLRERVRLLDAARGNEPPRVTLETTGTFTDIGIRLDTLSLDPDVLATFKGLAIVGYRVTVTPILQRELNEKLA